MCDLKKIFFMILFIFLERGEGRERGRETSMCGCLSLAPNWGPGPNPGMCPDWEPAILQFAGLVLNPLSHSGQGVAILFSLRAPYKTRLGCSPSSKFMSWFNNKKDDHFNKKG